MSDSTIIRITKEEATSEHIDDLLRRQMSMRGESGVTHSARKRWFVQGWLVFGLAGLLGAVLAWALLEPALDDSVYYRGAITAIAPSDVIAEPLKSGSGEDKGTLFAKGAVTVNGEKFHLFSRTKVLNDDGSRPYAAIENLQIGQRIGLYSEVFGQGAERIAIVTFIEPNPPEGEDTKETVTQLHSGSNAAGLVLFALVAGAIGLFIGAADGIVCRLPRRALLGGGIGLIVGLAGGFIASIFANLAYSPLNELAQNTGGTEEGFTAAGFAIQTGGRGIAWCLAGCAMGLGQGIALRSTRLLLYGLIGGLVGGLFGGLLFDPIDILLLGTDKPSSHVSRCVGLAVIGLAVGAMIGVVELLARNAWLRMTQGPLAGKEFLIFKDVMNVGSSPKSEIYLFNDPAVAAQHALLRAVGDDCEIEARDSTQPVLVNNRPITRVRLRHGDNVAIGRTMFVYQKRKS